MERRAQWPSAGRAATANRSVATHHSPLRSAHSAPSLRAPHSPPPPPATAAMATATSATVSRSSAWSLPPSHTDVGATMIAAAQSGHHARLAAARALTHTHSARDKPHAQVDQLQQHDGMRRGKPAQLAFERAAAVERDNLLLVQRLQSIIARKQMDNVAAATALPRSLNRQQRATRMVDVLEENEQMRRRIAAARSQLPTAAALHRRHDQLQQVVARHCLFPRQDPLRFKEQFYRHPSNTFCNEIMRSTVGTAAAAAAAAPVHAEEKSDDAVRPESAAASTAVVRHHARSLSAAVPPRFVPAPPGSRSASSVRPASARPQQHHQPQAPSALIAQEPLLLERRRPASARFRPLRMEQDTVALAQRAATLDAQAARARAAAAAASGAALVPRPPRRPATASATATASHARPAHSAHQHTLAGASTAVPAVAAAPAWAALPAAAAPAPAAFAPVPTPSPTAAHELDLFSGVVSISGRAAHVRLSERGVPWRVEALVADLDSGLEYHLDLPLRALRTLFAHRPRLLDPADPRRAALVQAILTAMAFVPAAARRALTGGAGAAGWPNGDGNGDGDDDGDSGALELCIDLVQTSPDPGPGSSDSDSVSVGASRQLDSELEPAQPQAPGSEMPMTLGEQAALLPPRAPRIRTEERERESAEAEVAHEFTPRTRTVIKPLSAAELAEREAAAMEATAAAATTAAAAVSSAISVNSDAAATAVVSESTASPARESTPPPPQPQPLPQPAEPTFVIPTRGRFSLRFAPAAAPPPQAQPATAPASDTVASADAAVAPPAAAGPPSRAPSLSLLAVPADHGAQDVSESSAAELARELNSAPLDSLSAVVDGVGGDGEVRGCGGEAEDAALLQRARAVSLPPSAPPSGAPSPTIGAMQSAAASASLEDVLADTAVAAAESTHPSAAPAAAPTASALSSSAADPSSTPSSSRIGAHANDGDNDDGNDSDSLFDDGDEMMSQIDELDAAAPILVVASRPSSARPSSLTRAASGGGSRPHTAGRERGSSDSRMVESSVSSSHSRQPTGSVLFGGVGGVGGGAAGFTIEEHGADSDADPGSDTLDELEPIDFETPIP